MADDERRKDLELRARIDAVSDTQVREALVYMHRRTAFYAQRNWERIGWLAHRTFVILGMVAVLSLAGAVVSGYLVAQNDHRTRDIHTLATSTVGALCALRSDLQARVANSEKFLKDHPAGIPGVPIATIRSSLNGQKRTIHALSKLVC